MTDKNQNPLPIFDMADEEKVSNDGLEEFKRILVTEDELSVFASFPSHCLLFLTKLLNTSDEGKDLVLLFLCNSARIQQLCFLDEYQKNVFSLIGSPRFTHEERIKILSTDKIIVYLFNKCKRVTNDPLSDPYSVDKAIRAIASLYNGVETEDVQETTLIEKFFQIMRNNDTTFRQALCVLAADGALVTLYEKGGAEYIDEFLDNCFLSPENCRNLGAYFFKKDHLIFDLIYIDKVDWLAKVIESRNVPVDRIIYFFSDQRFVDFFLNPHGRGSFYNRDHRNDVYIPGWKLFDDIQKKLNESAENRGKILANLLISGDYTHQQVMELFKKLPVILTHFCALGCYDIIKPILDQDAINFVNEQRLKMEP